MLKRKLKEPFGKAGLTVAILALVMAMVGGAYAAGALSGKQKKEVEKIAKKFAGKPGATGPAGAAGANGTNGKDGTNGTNGSPGAPGTSVTNTALAKGNVNCPEGGAEFKVGTGAPTRACNGTTGFTETLPEGMTETGTWQGRFEGVTEGTSRSPISFTIPLEAALEEANVHYVTLAAQASHSVPQCEGTAEAPEAEAENLCVYEAFAEEPSVTSTLRVSAIAPPKSSPAFEGAGVTGAILSVQYHGTSTESAELQGTWAVTG